MYWYFIARIFLRAGVGLCTLFPRLVLLKLLNDAFQGELNKVNKGELAEECRFNFIS